MGKRRGGWAFVALVLLGCPAPPVVSPASPPSGQAEAPAATTLVPSRVCAPFDPPQIVAVLDDHNVVLRQGFPVAQYEVVDVAEGVVRARMPHTTTTTAHVAQAGARLFLSDCAVGMQPSQRCLWDLADGTVSTHPLRGQALLHTGEVAPREGGERGSYWLRRGEGGPTVEGPDGSIDLGAVLDGGSAQLSSRGKLLGVVGGDALRLFAVPDLTPFATIALPSRDARVALSDRVVSVQWAGEHRFFDRNGRTLCQLPEAKLAQGGAAVQSLRWSLDGSRLSRVVDEGGTQVLQSHDVERCAERFAVRLDRPAQQVVWSEGHLAVATMHTPTHQEGEEGVRPVLAVRSARGSEVEMALPACRYFAREVLRSSLDEQPVHLGDREVPIVGADHVPLHQGCERSTRWRTPDGTIFDRDAIGAYPPEGTVVELEVDGSWVPLEGAVAQAFPGIGSSDDGTYLHQFGHVWRCRDGSKVADLPSLNPLSDLVWAANDRFAAFLRYDERYGGDDDFDDDDDFFEPSKVEVVVHDFGDDRDAVLGHVPRETQLWSLDDDFLIPHYGRYDPTAGRFVWTTDAKTLHPSPRSTFVWSTTGRCEPVEVRSTADGRVLARLDEGLDGYDPMALGCAVEWLLDERYVGVADRHHRYRIHDTTDWHLVARTPPGRLVGVAWPSSPTVVVQQGSRLGLVRLADARLRWVYPGAADALIMTPAGEVSGAPETLRDLARLRPAGPILEAPLLPVGERHPSWVQGDLLAD